MVLSSKPIGAWQGEVVSSIAPDPKRCACLPPAHLPPLLLAPQPAFLLLLEGINTRYRRGEPKCSTLTSAIPAVWKGSCKQRNKRQL